jgi:alkaline phosphatase
MLNGVTNYIWTKFDGPDVLFGAGAENFLPGSGSHKDQDYIKLVSNKGYLASSNKSLLKASNSSKALDLFCTPKLQSGSTVMPTRKISTTLSTILQATSQLLWTFQG